MQPIPTPERIDAMLLAIGRYYATGEKLDLAVAGEIFTALRALHINQQETKPGSGQKRRFTRKQLIEGCTARWLVKLYRATQADAMAAAMGVPMPDADQRGALEKAYRRRRLPYAEGDRYFPTWKALQDAAELLPKKKKRKRRPAT